MKTKRIFAAILLTLLSNAVVAQDITVDEIISNYLENIGGVDAWKKVKSIKLTGKVNQQGLEIPLEIFTLSDGRQYTKITFQGMDIMQGVYDGESLWSTNFQSMKAEKSDAETTENFKLELNDFPDNWIDYKEKGYAAELVGTETIDGSETYKVKLTKEPQTFDGKQVENVTYYYFDTEVFVPLAEDSEVKVGPQAGVVQRITYSDYDEVDGLYFPFSLTQGVKGGASQPLTFTSIEVNVTVDESVFAFPESGK